MNDIVIFALSSAGGFIGALAGVKTDIQWIKRTLFYHNNRISKLEQKGV